RASPSTRHSFRSLPIEWPHVPSTSQTPHPKTSNAKSRSPAAKDRNQFRVDPWFANGSAQSPRKLIPPSLLRSRAPLPSFSRHHRANRGASYPPQETQWRARKGPSTNNRTSLPHSIAARRQSTSSPDTKTPKPRPLPERRY